MRLIDADALYQAFENAKWHDNNDRDLIAEDILMDTPTIEPTTPRGHWTINTDDFTPAWRCSNCGYNKPMLAGESAKQEPKSFCQSCGADMRGDHD